MYEYVSGCCVNKIYINNVLAWSNHHVRKKILCNHLATNIARLLNLLVSIRKYEHVVAVNSIVEYPSYSRQNDWRDSNRNRQVLLNKKLLIRVVNGNLKK